MTIKALPILLALLTSLFTCDTGEFNMGSVRAKRIHGRDGYAKSDGDVQQRGKKKDAADTKLDIDTTPDGDEERSSMSTDYLHLYDNYMAGTLMNAKTGEPEKMKLGLLQKFMMDFSLLDCIDDIVQHSPLAKHLPAKDEQGNYPERWLYWRTLEGEPEIQEGPEGPVSDLFYGGSGKMLQGMVIKVAGNGRTKCLLAPRNHLKSTCGQLETQFRIIRNPSDSHVIRTARQNLAKRFLRGIAKHWKHNKKFRQYYGHLVPEKREGEWSTESIQLLLPVEEEVGNDPTLTTIGNATEATGEHWKTCTMDDVVAEKNSKTPDQLEATRDLYSAVNAQRGGGNGLLQDRGTRWSPDDAHGLFMGKPGANEWSGSMAEFSCFFLATALDADESVTVEPLKNGLTLTQLGYGKPIWDGFPLSALKTTRALMPSDRFYYGQYFNQFYGTSELMLDESWITYIEKYPDFTGDEYKKFEDNPIALAKHLELDIYIAFDTARGKEVQTVTTDRTAGIVIGQTKDRRFKFVLGGFCEKLQKQYIPKGIVDLCLLWREVASTYSGIFRAGFEKTAYTDWVGPMVETEQRKRGITSVFSFQELDHQNRQKWTRIVKLVQPYFERNYFWPITLIVPPVHPERIEPYDLLTVLKTEFKGYHPAATLDDLLDAHAYADEMCPPVNWKDESVQNRMRKTELGTYDVTAAPGWDDRSTAMAATQAAALREFEYDGEIGL